MAKAREYRFVTDGLRRLLRVVGLHADGLERLGRSALRRERVCIGCREADGETLVPGLGWLCELCHEVIPLVYEIEIERMRGARTKVQAFIESLKQ